MALEVWPRSLLCVGLALVVMVGVLVLDRGVATYSAAYTWTPNHLDIDSAGLRYSFDARVDADDLTLKNEQFGTVVYHRTAS
jgi:hypothetical protein